MRLAGCVYPPPTNSRSFPHFGSIRSLLQTSQYGESIRFPTAPASTCALQRRSSGGAVLVSLASSTCVWSNGSRRIACLFRARSRPSCGPSGWMPRCPRCPLHLARSRPFPDGQPVRVALATLRLHAHEHLCVFQATPVQDEFQIAVTQSLLHVYERLPPAFVPQHDGALPYSPCGMVPSEVRWSSG